MVKRRNNKPTGGVAPKPRQLVDNYQYVKGRENEARDIDSNSYPATREALDIKPRGTIEQPV